MKEPQVHEIAFVDDNHYNLYLFCRHLQANVVNPERFAVEKQEYRDRYKVSIGNQLFYVAADSLNKLWLELDKGSVKIYEILKNKIFDEQEMQWNPGIDLSDQEFPIDESDEFYSLIGLDYLNVESRVKGVMSATATTITEIAHLLNKEMAAVALNTDIVKDFDGIVTFRTELGKEFNVELCFDKIKPVDPANQSIEIQRTPVTPEDLKTFFPDAGEKIQSRLVHVNGLVKSLFESKRIAESEILTKYAAGLINGALVPTFLDLNINYIIFGGRDDWSSPGKDTPNNLACFKYLDEEIEKIFEMLGNIPLEEGVEVWSMDIDTFAIFGRKDNKVVTPALQGYVENLLLPFSQGFEKILTQRLSLLDTPHIFKA